MKNNKAFSLVELIIVLGSLTMVTLFFWSILTSSSKDTYTLEDKMEVQTSVTNLMNTIQSDIQEAKIYQITADKRGIVEKVGDEYLFANITYKFDGDNKTVTRKENGEEATFSNIISFLLEEPENTNKYGAKVTIIGGKKDANTTDLDKTRYTLTSTYYTRNTI